MTRTTTMTKRATDRRTSTTTLRVRYAECDPMGVVHHATFPIYFEMGRTELYRSGGMTYRELEAQGLRLVVVALEVRYRSPARYDDVLTLETTLASVTRAKLLHEYRLHRDGVLIATGRTTLGCVDEHGRVRPLPDTMSPSPD
jgi:acyl-CoA thioester hydrolase